MSVSQIKKEILQALLLETKPKKAAYIAKNIGKEFPSVQMHLIGLTRIGYTESPQKGYYTISPVGKIVLGLAKLSKENAQQILSQTSPEKAFHFYAGIGKPLNIFAHSLLEFKDKINMVDSHSLAFHLNRGDFEAWFRSLGDLELAMKMGLLRKRSNQEEVLPLQIREIMEDRCRELYKTADRTEHIM
jgi:hypothetical protein